MKYGKRYCWIYNSRTFQCIIIAAPPIQIAKSSVSMLWVRVCVFAFVSSYVQRMFSSWIRWLLVELKSNSSIWTSLYPIQDVAVVDVGFKVSSLSLSLHLSVSHFALVSFSVVFEFFLHVLLSCVNGFVTPMCKHSSFLSISKNEIHFILFSSLFHFVFFFSCLSFWSIWRSRWESTFMFILLMECWQFQRIEENIHPSASTREIEKWKGAKRIPFSAHMIAMFAQIILLLYNKMHWFEGMTTVESEQFFLASSRINTLVMCIQRKKKFANKVFVMLGNMMMFACINWMSENRKNAVYCWQRRAVIFLSLQIFCQ